MANLSGSVGRNGKNLRSDVMTVQRLLNADMPVGKAPLAEDGVFGPKTLAALTEFQRRKSLAQTGLISSGDSTWVRLGQALTAVRAPSPQAPVLAGPSAAWPAKFTFEQFWNFTEPLEGGIAANCMFMVQDLQVATGMGITFMNKANRNVGVAMAAGLEWVFKPEHAKANQKCSRTDIELDYDTVLSMEELGRKGPGGHLPEWKKITNCRITLDEMKRAVKKRIIGNINHIRTQKGASLGNFDSFPADAQLCIASLTWARGNDFDLFFPKFAEACRAADWFEAAEQCTFSNKENTLQKRSAQQQLMMRNAGFAKVGLGDPDTLHFPGKLDLPPNPYDELKTTYRERHHEISRG